MDRQIIINQAVDRYHKLDAILRKETLEYEHAAFLQGRMVELILLISSLDEQAVDQLTRLAVDTRPEEVSTVRHIRVNLN